MSINILDKKGTPVSVHMSMDVYIYMGYNKGTVKDRPPGHIGGFYMNTFEIGKKYFDTSACDHNCVFVVEIIKRTAKTVTFRRDGKERRAKIYADQGGEYIIPDRYSMAPTFRACREYVEAAAGEVAEEAAPAAVTLAYVGQRVVCNCGAMFPLVDGVIVGFAEQEATRWTPATTLAAIRWEDGRQEYKPLERIRPFGQRAPGGSPLGVFFAR